MTHDLIRNLFDALGAEVTDIVIDDLREGTFFAKVRYVYDDDEAQLDARPSDAVALAVRAEAPIFVSTAVLDEAGFAADDDDDGTDEPDDEPTVAEREPDRTASRAVSKLDRLEQQLEKAIANEDYEAAAKLRDDIARAKGDN